MNDDPNAGVLRPDAGDPEWEGFYEDLFRLCRSEGCHHGEDGEDARHARRLLEERGYDADASLALYRESGGYCDLEVLLNTLEAAVAAAEARSTSAA
jgi:Protein of unknown function (DUF2695)